MVTRVVRDLDRCFVEIGADKSIDPGQAALVSRVTGRTTGWAEVLRHRRAVLLGEAGTGKTEEFRLQRDRCRAEGTPAFFARIEDLAEDGLALALDPAGDGPECRAWIEGTGPAVFLLDSVDEARLKGQDFGRALRRLAGELGAAAMRATVLVSCRVSDWQAHADRRTVEHHLPPPPPTEEGGEAVAPDGPAVRVFAFAPLDDGQVRRLCVEVHGLPDVDAFLRDVRDAQAEDFLHRPRDVEWMVGHWRSTGRIGTLTEVLDANVRKKLAEPRHLERPRHADLSADRLMAGARSLAAAVTFGRKAALRLPDHGPVIDAAADALDPAEVLTGWTDQERQELLSRALFDEATYGRLRFHHRSVVECLTARWLADRLDQGCPPAEIEGLLFPTVYGHRVAAPSLAAAAGWLAGWNDRIRSRALAVAPAILIEHGDPRSLPVDDRAGILTSAVERLHAEPQEDEGLSYDVLHRFATPELEPTLRALHDRFGSDLRVSELLLRLIHHGRMTGCADIALAAVLTGRNRTQRSYGLFALEAVGGVAHKAALADHLVAGAPSWDEESLGRALELCIPDGMTAARLLDVVGAVTVPYGQFGDGLQEALANIATGHLPREWLSDVLSGFLRLILRQPFLAEDEDGRASARHAGLRKALSRLVVRVLRDLGPSEVDEDDVVRTILFLKDTCWRFRDTDAAKEAMRAALAPFPTLKRTLLWRESAEEKTRNGRLGRTRFDVFWADEGYWALADNDTPWLLDDLRSRAEPNDRALALDCAMMLSDRLGRPPDLLTGIREAVHGSEELVAEVARWLEPPPPRAADEWRRAWEELEREREEVDAAAVEKARVMFSNGIDRIRSGEAIGMIGDLLAHIAPVRASGVRTDTSPLIPLFGEAVAEAAREGLKSCWRAQAESDGGGDWELMLSGFALAIEDGLDPATLSDAEARMVAGAALRVPNSFPPWFESLANAKSAAVREVLLSSLDEAWTRVEDGHWGTVGRLVSGPAMIRDRVAADVLSRLEREAPAGVEVTRAAVRLALTAAVVPRDRIVALAARRTHEARGDRPRLLIWLPLWLDLDGPAALDFLEQELAGLSADQAEALVMDLCDGLRRSFRHVGRPIGSLPSHGPSLTRIVAVLFGYIRVSEDHPHDRGVFTPDRRDHAEEVRNTALRLLADIPGKATHDALLDLADRLGNVAAPLWFRRLAAQRAAADGDPVPWAPAAVMAFERDHEAMPTSPADLHRIALRRLAVIRADLEGGDFSVRRLFGDQTDEDGVQRWFADALRLRANHRYSVHREEQVDRSKRPDIRLHNPAFDGPVCIEIKVMEKGWTVPQLEAALETQLVGQYLRDARSRHGILLLFRTGGKTSWRPTGSAPIGFDQLLERLQAHADDLVRRHPGVDRLDVVGMDSGDPP